MEISKEFVSYEQALALKELGFDEPCFAIYSHNNEFYKNGTFHLSKPHFFTDEVTPIEQDSKGDKSVYIIAPLYQQAFRFFREKYGLMGIVNCWVRSLAFYYDTVDIINEIVVVSQPEDLQPEDLEYSTYEEAQDACLDKLIELAKTHTK